ncbi:hypothetical protein JW960_19790 [candidate division KSB1 bacterium]|nr:hypothetical protein [candidate division KSB1 bacterium]
MKNRFTVIWVFLFLFIAKHAQSQVTMSGGRGLLRVQSANVVAPADIYVNGIYSTYFEKIRPEKLATFHSIYLNGTVGLSHNLEFVLNLVPYLETQDLILGRLGDTQVALKYMLPLSSSFFQWGLQAFYKFPTAYEPNVRYEVFYTDKQAWGTRFLTTMDFVNVFASSPFKLIMNIGYLDHDISDDFFKSEIDQLLFGVGIKVPFHSNQIYLEYTGELFINNHSDSLGFNDNPTRVSLGMSFLGPKKLTMDIAGDVSLAKPIPWQQNDIGIFPKDVADWRVWFGATYRFSVYKYFDKSAKIAREKREQELRKLERIKKKRIRANRDIDKMRELLKKKKPEDDN